jgi:restriction system protein
MPNLRLVGNRKQEFYGIPAAGHPTTQEYNYQAIVRTFDVSEKLLPLDTLLTHLRKKTSILYDIHPRKMEEVVRYVFSSYYSCDVIHCGKSHDNGIDLIMIDSDEPTLIQVKRRQSPDHVESVSVIREFLGALLVNRSRKGIFVSTADHYSKETFKTIDTILGEDVVTKFDLIDYNRFTEMLSVIKNEKKEPWISLIV